MLTKQQLVVIGNGMVGCRLCEELIEKKSEEIFKIVVFGNERLPAYDRVHLSEYFAGKSADDLTLQPVDWYVKHGIDLWLGDHIMAIDRKNKYVISEQGCHVPYDKLVLATGSSPFVPPVSGAEKKGVFVYRTLEDLDNIILYSKQVKTAAVIGGGLLGLEAAKAMMDLGVDTHVVECAPSLMPRQLDEAAGKFLQLKIEDLGVNVHLNKLTHEFRGNGRVESILFADASELAVDMVVISAGIRAADELGKRSDLQLGARGGIAVNNYLQTSDPDIYAIGECASHENTTYGLVGPGYQMASVLADNLLGATREFSGADMSCQLKLLGVDVASFGDTHSDDERENAVILENHKDGIYKKLILSEDGQRLLGGMLVGDTSDYGRLLSSYQAGVPIPKAPESLLVPPATSSDKDATSVAFLPASAMVCSCNNVTKGDLVQAIRQENIQELAGLKGSTKGGTGCGGCIPLMKDILALELEKSGVAIDRSLCEHFPYDRQGLRELIQKNKLYTFGQVLEKYGTGQGCEVCRPAIASILAGCWNDHVLNHQDIQDTNDHYMANTQRNGTYSVVPRVPGGELTPDQLIAIGQVAKEFDLYTKITGGQRIDLFGARLEDLPKIWQKLIDAGMESGHAYGKALRTVKSCVGSTWCRFGVQDSTSLAIELENRYKGLRAPHKIKGGVSGCIRECAEAQSKDFGVIATEQGWNLYVCGNGGAKPQHAILLASDIDTNTVIRYLDRFLMYYIHTAEHLTRTATWLNNMDGGIDHLKDVVIHDSLGIAEQLEYEMQQLINSYQCEWTATLQDPDKLKRFRPFLNTEETDPTIQFIKERGQIRPAPPVKQPVLELLEI